MEKLITVSISVLFIILLAILSERSHTIAAISATMPTKLPIGIWIIYIANNGNQEKLVEFNAGMFFSIIPTVLFIAAAWYAAKAGWSLVPIIAFGYVVWAVALGSMMGIRQLLS